MRVLSSCDRRLWYLLAIAIFASLCSTTAAGELVANGGMESPFFEGVAGGWRSNRWGQNAATYAPGPAHWGRSSQAIACQSFQNGGVALRCPLKGPVVAGRRYTVSLWMKTKGFVGMVRVTIRQRTSLNGDLFTASLQPDEAWRRYAFEGISGKSAEQAELRIMSGDGAPGTLWIDDVSVADAAPQMAASPPATGNVVPNADFEIALDRDWQGRSGEARLDSEAPFHGQRSLRWDLDGESADFFSRPIEFAGDGRHFTLALASRACGDATLIAEVWPAVKIGADKPLLKIEAKPSADWRVFRSTGPLPSSNNGAYYLTVRLRARQPASVWLDAIRLEPGDGGAVFHCRRPIEASLTCAPVGHIFREGKPITIGVQAYCDGAQPRSAALVCRVTDYWRRLLAEVPVSLDLKPRSAATATVRVPLRATGVFLAELVDGDETLSGVSFSVLPEVSSVPAQRSAVGGHFLLDEFHLEVANAMGVKWTRLHDCETFANWDGAEPRKGQFVWRDDKVALARRHGVQLLGEFLRVPQWANPRGKYGPPPDLDDFAAYIRAVVGHYRRDIRHWEIWNEPYITSYWKGTPAQYAEMAKRAAREAHAVNPGANLLAPCCDPGYVAFFEPALAAGALEGANVFSFHAYEVLHPRRYDILHTWAASGRNQPLPI